MQVHGQGALLLCKELHIVARLKSSNYLLAKGPMSACRIQMEKQRFTRLHLSFIIVKILKYNALEQMVNLK